ncbi:ribulokinase [Pontibacter sp. G13]|uniref:ribulokinase n=1 Tax=Pontibacter sp. G13 TaxID=3074898 RepID=UPI00288BFE67|nr:ribulokinase [Pontibacter sp. G13]WNJ19116.1 ribulokinase [Pontibacter sp. G13]
MESREYALGLDFGSDSVRAMIVTTDGEIVATAVSYYAQWKAGKFCNAVENQFRQHPQDYVDSMTEAVQAALLQAPAGTGSAICGIGVDTTGSTPVAVDRTGTPLSMLPEFADNPNAMFVLWKDHTAIAEADEINAHNAAWSSDYLKYVGGIYSSEWFWAKLLHILRVDEQVADAAYSWVEHCDWLPFELCGGTDADQIKRSRCAAGHKALWHAEWGGLPPEDYLTGLDEKLAGWRDRLFSETYPSDESVGTISAAWAQKLGINPEAVVAVGAFDAHMGAVGGEIEPYQLSRVMGTSTCDILVAPASDLGDRCVEGICGQVDGSVIPGMVGLEAGQSAFGDVYAWFRNLINWPVREIIGQHPAIDPETRTRIIEEAADQTIAQLSQAAAELPIDPQSVIALDWVNGRRTPDANQRLKGALMNMNMGTDAPRIFRALVESTCFGARAIVERFESEGVQIEGLIGLGGVSRKSPFVMQTLADVLKRPIRISATEQTCALGAAMFGAVAAGKFEQVEQAMKAMGQGFDQEYHPTDAHAALYDECYQAYLRFGAFAEEEVSQPQPTTSPS